MKSEGLMAKKVFLNDGIIDAGLAKVSVADSSFLYGAGLFETMRCDGGVIFSLSDHLDRLFGSGKALSINISYDKKYISDALYNTIEANGLKDARIRLTVSNTLPSEDDPGSTLLISATKLEAYPEQLYEKGALAVLSPYKQNPADPTVGHKTTSYFSRLMALKYAHQKNATEAIWFTVDNRLAEGCVSNIFLVKDGVIHTPSVDTPILAGVARKTICQIARDNSMELVEGNLSIDDLLGADEVFLSNVIMRVLPVTNIEAHQIGDGQVGSITKKMAELFIKKVKLGTKK